MAEIWYDVDAALSEVPVNKVPLVASADGFTIDSDVNYNAAGLSVIWNFVTTAGAYTQTAVTPTDTGGNYDWVEQGNGMFTIEIPASGGATINNDTEGFGWFTGTVTGCLPFSSPVYGFRAAGLNNALIDSAYSTTRGLAGTAVPDVAGGAAGGLVLGSAANNLAVDAAGKVAVPDTQKVDIETIKTRAVTCGAGVTVNPSVGAATIQPTVTEFEARTLPAADYTIVSDLGTVQTADHTAAIADIPTVAEFTARSTADPATQTLLTAVAGYIDTEIGTISTAVITTIPNAISALPTDADVNAACDTAISDAALATATNLATVDTVVDAIKVQTDKLAFTVANQVDANIQSVNDKALTGDGSALTPWGPA